MNSKWFPIYEEIATMLPVNCCELHIYSFAWLSSIIGLPVISSRQIGLDRNSGVAVESPILSFSLYKRFQPMDKVIALCR